MNAASLSILVALTLAGCAGESENNADEPPVAREAITAPAGNTPPVSGANDGHATTTTVGRPGGPVSAQVAATGSADCLVDQRRYAVAFAVERAGTCTFSKSQHGKPALSLELLPAEGSADPSRLQALVLDFKGPGNYQTSPDGSQVSITGAVPGVEGGTRVLTGQNAGGPACTIAVGESDLATVPAGQQALVPVTITRQRLFESSQGKEACNMTPNSWELAVPCTSADGPL